MTVKYRPQQVDENRLWVAVVGSANADLPIEVPHLPTTGETVLGSDATASAGGKGANQAAACARMGAPTRFVGSVGADANGDHLRQALTRAGVAIEALTTSDAPTGTAVIMVDPDGDDAIVVAPSANRGLTLDVAERYRRLWADAMIVLLQCEVPLETVTHVGLAAHESGTRVILNAAPAIALAAGLLQVCDPLVVNQTEAAELLAGDPGALDAAEIVAALLRLGPRSVVLTLGARGAAFATQTSQQVCRVNAMPVPAVDTTGAGDAFVGALAAERPGPGRPPRRPSRRPSSRPIRPTSRHPGFLPDPTQGRPADAPPGAAPSTDPGT